MFEKPTNPQEKISDPIAAVEACRTLEELEETVRRMGEIPGSKKSYRAEEVADLIRLVRTADMLPHSITRTYGIRDKVIALQAQKSGN